VTVPLWVWAASAAGLLAVAAAEVALTGRRSGDRGLMTRRAVRWVAVYVSLALIFGLGLAVMSGWVAASQFYAGYLTEYSLSLDNLFIFYVIMSRLAVSPARQHRVLAFGIGLSLALRSILIVAGLALISRFDWLFYPLGGLLLWTAAGLLTGRGVNQPQERHTRLPAWLRRRLAAGSMLLVIVAIGVADAVFALDSIPAIFGITTSAYLIVAANAFALMGLRQAYVLLARFLDRIVYLNKGLAVICAFIGVKLLLQAVRGSGAGWAVEIPAWLSVTIVATVLLVTVIAGMRSGRKALTEAQDALFGALLRHMDGNGDLEITQEEFTAAFGRTKAGRPGFDAAVLTAARALVQRADLDGNGVLDAAEYAALTAVYGASADEAARTFRRLDLDRNGVLDSAEITAAISQGFTG
jgi:tellurite resistance protein TerC